jgi:hypothetical protein
MPSENLHGESATSTYSVLGLNEGVVDSNDLDIRVLNGIAEDDTTDTAETVDADLDRSHFCLRRK